MIYFLEAGMSRNIEKAIDDIKKKEIKIKNFSDILDSIESTENKKKLLWKEIYENALEDRENANILFTDLLLQSRGNSATHEKFGTMMSKYLERMAKSTDQIIRLAELISKEESTQTVSADDIFNKISG